ncbi:MAG: ATP-binding cassette domain-containing protein [Actinomycetota bacterium]|nr:ATP-binding cassette domain-containing protein [Actinomycetota bacterium]
MTVDGPTPSPAPLLVDITTSAGTFTVTAGFEAHTGITVLFGPSGSGKSVTLATIAGLLRPTKGSIVLHGRTIADAEAGIHIKTQDRHLGMVTQHAALLPHRSPVENVGLALRTVGTSAQGAVDRRARREEAVRLLAETGAAHLAEANTTSLSGGERQRVALARALAGHPQLLLLDEPFSALDRVSRTRLRSLVRRLSDERQLPVLLVTHDLDDVEALADRIVEFEPGRTVGQRNVDPTRPAERRGSPRPTTSSSEPDRS